MMRVPGARLWPLLFLLLAAAILRPALAEIRQVVVGAPSTPSAPFADAVRMFYPLRSFANGELQQGRLPLWNPYILCGHSMHGEGQGAIFYPLNLLLAPLSPQVAMNIFALAHFAAAGIFFALYLQACGLRRFSAFFGGFVYMCSSGPVSRLFAGHYTIIPFLALVPALLWAWESWRNTGRWGKVWWCGVVLGCMILAGYPQMLFYAALYLGWHALVEVAIRYRAHTGRAAAAPLLFYIAAVLAGAALGAVQLLPSYAFARESLRMQVTYDTIALFSFSPENLLTLLLPRFFGNMGEGITPYWGRNLLWENWIYIGIVPLALAILALVRVRTPLVVAHGLAVPVFLVLALGRHTPLHRFLYDHVPFFDYFRGSSKFSFFVLFSLAALAGIGADRLLNEPDPGRQRGDRFTVASTLAFFAALGVVLGIALGIGHLDEGSVLSRFVRWRLAQGETWLQSDFFSNPDLLAVWGQVLPQLTRLAAVSLTGLLLAGSWPILRRNQRLACTALCLAVFPEMLQFSTGEPMKAPIGATAIAPVFLRELKSDPTRARVLAPELARNAFLPDRVESPLGYVGNMTKRYNNFLTAVNGVERSESMVETPVFRLTPQFFRAAVSHLVLDEREKLPPGIATQLARDADQILYRLEEEHPRASFSREVMAFASAEEALLAFESGSFEFSAADLLEIPEGRALPSSGPPTPGDRVAVVESLPSRTVVRTYAAGARLLVLADAYESGWRCRLEDGAALAIHPVNIAFRGVIVPPGDHTLTFSYAPRGFAAGAVISALAVLAAVCGGVWLFVRRGAASRT
jgi:hypothetical protein